jgi:ABC-2 type transport system ATP-binding protein
MIEVEGLTKHYGRLTAIKDVTFRVEAGEIVGFLGPNGAGKTTTMRILTCFSPQSSGRASILGMDSRENSLEIRRKLGYLPEHVPIYAWMRVQAYLEFVARSKAIAGADRAREVMRVAEATGIDQVMGKVIRHLSKGFKQRVGLAQALIGDPRVLILDEPTIGLDPRQIREIRQLIKGFSQNRTVILSTHILPEVSQICDRVIIINKGQIVAEDTPDNLTHGHGTSSRCQLVVGAPEKDVEASLSRLAGVKSVRVTQSVQDGRVEALLDATLDVDMCPIVARTVLEKGWDLFELRPIHASLEDVFIDLVTEETEGESLAQEDERREMAS